MADAKKATLPPGDPEAGYVTSDLTLEGSDGIDLDNLPDNLKDWHEEKDEAYKKQVEAVAENEDKVAKERAAEAEKAAKEAAAQADDTSTTTSPKTTKASASSA